MLDRETNHPSVIDFADLLANLDAQRHHYDQLLLLSERERAAIGANDLAELAAIIAEKEAIVATALGLERQRQAACERWAQILALATPPTLYDLRARADSSMVARQLEAAAIALSDRVQRLRQVNTLNAQLIAQVREVVRPQIAALAQHGQVPLYDRRGETALQHQQSSIFDVKA